MKMFLGVLLGIAVLVQGLMWIELDLKRQREAADQEMICMLEATVKALAWQRDFWRERATEAHGRIAVRKLRIVEVTAYSATRSQCDDDPWIAASMKPPRPGTVAVSRDLFDIGWTFGCQVHLKGLGTYTVNDVMNVRHRQRVDVFIGDVTEAHLFGSRTMEAVLLRG